MRTSRYGLLVLAAAAAVSGCKGAVLLVTDAGARADGGSPTDAGGTSDGGASVDGGADAGPATPATPQLWYWHHSYLSAGNASEPAKSLALVDLAVDAGYTGLALWDSSMSFVQRAGWDASKLQTVVNYATAHGLKVLPGTAPFGYSNDLLQTDPNLAEGQRLVGSRFQVVGNQLQPVNSLPPLVNGGFESGKTGWFSIGDPRCDVGTTAAHTGSASGIIRGAPGATDNARFEQTLTVTPWRLYHVRFWYQTQNLAGGAPAIEVLDFTTVAGTALSRFYASLTPQPTQAWTQVDFMFNSQSSTSVSLYLGIWGGNQGNFWVDDISADETSLVNLLRRPGTPLSIYDPTTLAVYAEGTDVNPINDPGLVASPGNYDAYHAPPAVTLPAGTHLTAGQTVAMDSYSIVPIWGGQVGACLSEAPIQQWVLANVTVLDPLFPQGAGYFVGYDEMRHMNSCATCRAKGDTAGQLLAWNVQQTLQTIQTVRPGAQLYFWSDMFDPNHNAHDNYYLVEGDLSGSWLGLPSNAIIMNWNLGNLTKSFSWFSGTTSAQPVRYRQIIAGYYDSGDGAGAATQEMNAVAGLPGLVGAMYTSWNDDYTQLKPFADTVRAAWPAYRASAP